MSTTKQAKTIAAQLEVLDELKQELDNASTRMDYVHVKDVSQTCACESLNVGTLINSRSITIKSLREKMKRHKKQYKQVETVQTSRNSTNKSKQYKQVEMRFEEMENKNFHNFDQITDELYSASNFMASLQESIDSLSLQVKENAKQINDLTNIRDQHKHFNLKLIKQEEKCDSLLRLQKSVEHTLLSQLEHVVNQQNSTSNHVNKTRSECEAISHTVNNVISCFDNLNLNVKSLEENVKHVDQTFKESENKTSREFENLSRQMQTLNTIIGNWQSGSFNLGLEETKKELKDMTLNFDSIKKNVSDLADRQRNLVSRASFNLLAQLQKQKADELELKMSDLDKKNIKVVSQVSKLATDIVNLRHQGYQYIQQESQKLFASLTTSKMKPEKSKEQRGDKQTGLRQGEKIAGDMRIKLEEICSEMKALTDCLMYIQEEIEILESKFNRHEEIISQF